MENSTRSPFQSSHLDDFPWLCLTCPLIHAGANSLNIEKEIVIFLRHRKKWNKKTKERLERANFRPFSNPVVTFSPPTRNNLFFCNFYLAPLLPSLSRAKPRKRTRPEIHPGENGELGWANGEERRRWRNENWDFCELFSQRVEKDGMRGRST